MSVNEENDPDKKFLFSLLGRARVQQDPPDRPERRSALVNHNGVPMDYIGRGMQRLGRAVSNENLAAAPPPSRKRPRT